MNRTPLYENHLQQRGMIADYGEWELPARFHSLENECRAAHSTAALFDSSASGKFYIRGNDAGSFIKKLLPTLIDSRPPGSAVQSCLCSEHGIIIDTVQVYHISRTEFMISGSYNAAERDFRWMSSLRSGDIEIENVSSSIAKIDCIGPYSSQAVSELFPDSGIENQPQGFLLQTMYVNRPILLSRTVFAGIDCCEIILHADMAPLLWKTLSDKGKNYGLLPIGMDARFMLTLVNGFPLFGYELSRNLSPKEAGLRYMADSDAEYIGKTKIEENLRMESGRSLVTIECRGKGTAHAGVPLFLGEFEAGTIIRTGRLNSESPLIASAVIPSGFAGDHQVFHAGKPSSQLFAEIISEKRAAVFV